MKMNKMGNREIAMLIFMVLILVSVLYYMGFYKPTQEEMASLATQSVELDDQINAATMKVGKMKQMQQELDVILAQPKFQITEIAPYDNKDVVLNMLNGVLGRTDDYSLSFTDPAVNGDGTVRRNVTMSFNSESYEAAKVVIRDFTKSKWRCMVSNLTFDASGSDARAEKVLVFDKDDAEIEEDDDRNIMQDEIAVTTTITFFESTKLSK